MKKIISIALVLALAFTMTTGCAQKQEANKLEQIKAAGVLVVGTSPDYPPYEFIVPGAGGEMEYVGIDVDIAEEIAKDMGVELVIDSMPFDSVIASVSAGKADVGVSALSILPERLNYVDFSDVYYTAHQACLTKKDSGIATAEDLQGKTIGAQEGTSGQFTAEEYTDVDKIFPYQKVLDAVIELQNGKLDCVIADDHTIKAILASLNDDTMVIANIEFPEEEYAIAVGKNQPELLAAINASLARMKEDGTYDALVEKWLGAAEENSDAE